MTQNLILKYNGINNLEIGQKINDSTDLKLEPSNKFSSTEKIKFYFPKEYDYYFIAKDSLLINNIGIAKQVFFATDKNGIVIMMILFINNGFLNKNFETEISKVFESEPLIANSGIGIENENLLMNWIKNKYSLNLRISKSSIYTRITLNKLSGKENYANIKLD